MYLQQFFNISATVTDSAWYLIIKKIISKHFPPNQRKYLDYSFLWLLVLWDTFGFNKTQNHTKVLYIRAVIDLNRIFNPNPSERIQTRNDSDLLGLMSRIKVE